jgi:hypothetical protein
LKIAPPAPRPKANINSSNSASLSVGHIAPSSSSTSSFLSTTPLFALAVKGGTETADFPRAYSVLLLFICINTLTGFSSSNLRQSPTHGDARMHSVTGAYRISSPGYRLMTTSHYNVDSETSTTLSTLMNVHPLLRSLAGMASHHLGSQQGKGKQPSQKQIKNAACAKVNYTKILSTPARPREEKNLKKAGQR